MALKSSLLLSLGICKRSPTTTGYLNSIWDSQAFSLCLLPGAFQFIFCLEHALCHLPATSASWVAALPRCPSVYSSNTVALRLPGSRPLASLKVLSNGCAYSHALDLRARARAGREQAGQGRARACWGLGTYWESGMHCLEVLGSGQTYACTSPLHLRLHLQLCSSRRGQNFPKQSGVLSTLGRSKGTDMTARPSANFCSGCLTTLAHHPPPGMLDKGEKGARAYA